MYSKANDHFVYSHWSDELVQTVYYDLYWNDIESIFRFTYLRCYDLCAVHLLKEIIALYFPFWILYVMWWFIL